MTRVVAFATSRQAYFDLFMESCRRHGIAPVPLGWGDRWIGFGRKTTAIRDCIRDLPDDEIVISVDPFDVVFLTGLQEIEEKFRAGSARFLCGALKLGPFLRGVYRSEFNRSGRSLPKTPTGYDFLNSGTWISTAGYARHLIDRLEHELGMKPTDMDQEILTSLYIDERSTVQLDWRCEIFHNLLFRDFVTRRPDLKDIAFVDGRILNTLSGTRPCVLHASGNAHLEGIALSLGYDRRVIVPFRSNANFLRKAAFHIKEIIESLRLALTRRPRAVVRADTAPRKTSVTK
jgi:hypothetical protein